MERQSTEEILIEYGIHLGFERPRKDLARDLERNGLTEGDLRMVMDHVRDGGTAKSAGARISATISDKDRWGPLLVDLRKFHQYRLNKEARMGKRKAEPGKNLRERDQEVRDTGAAAFAQMTEDEYANLKWRWCVADWSHGGHEPEKIQESLGATSEELASCLEQFPKKVSFDDALSEHMGKTNGSNTGPD